MFGLIIGGIDWLLRPDAVLGITSSTGFYINGYVKDQLGNGIPGVIITVPEAQENSDSCPKAMPAFSTATTNGNGYYALMVVTEGGGWTGACNYITVKISKPNCTFVSPQRLLLQSPRININGTCVKPPPVSTSTPSTSQVTGFATSTATIATSALLPGECINCGTNERISLETGQEKTYVAKIENSTLTSLRVEVVGLTNGTYAEISLIFPDGRVFPTGATGQNHVIGVSSNGTVDIRTQKNPQGGNVSDQYLPARIL